jgi:peptidylprolyl isomerase
MRALRTLPLLFGLLLAACDSPPAPSTGESAKPTAEAPASAAQSAPLARPEPPKPVDLPAPPDVAAPPADAQKTASGLVTKVLTPGNGKDHPATWDSVKVHYTGWTKAGRMFDSSVTRNQPAVFKVNGVIKGWTEGLQLMVAGEKRRFWIPAALAYGERPPPGAPAGELTFDVELLEVTAGPKPPPVPEDVKAAPAAAKKTASGLAYRVLKDGKGKESPKATNMVRVHYTGWTTDGQMFDSSVTRGSPATFRLDQVIKGWTEGLQLMKVGDTARFWIPGKLAYGDNPMPGQPKGMLVFDVELLGIQ